MERQVQVQGQSKATIKVLFFAELIDKNKTTVSRKDLCTGVSTVSVLCEITRSSWGLTPDVRASAVRHQCFTQKDRGLGRNEMYDV